MPKSFLSFIYIIVAMFSIQFGASVAKKIFPIAGPAGTTMMRVTLAALMLLAMWRPWRIKWTKKNWLIFLGYGISLGGMNLTFYFALERIPLGIAVALEFAGPLGLAILSSKKPVDFLWAILAAAGIILILPIGPSTEHLDIVGILYALFAGVLWAFYILFGKASGKDIHSGHATAMGMTFAAILTIPFGIAINGPQVANPSLIPMGLAIALLSSAIPYSLEMMAMKNIPTKTFGILMSMEPAVATLMGFLFLHETLSLTQFSAIIMIIVASLGTTLAHTNS